MNERANIYVSTADEVGELKRRIRELEDRVREYETRNSAELSSMGESLSQMVLAAVDAHDRLVALERNNFPGMHPDLDRIADIVPYTNPLLDNKLDRRPQKEPPSDETEK